MRDFGPTILTATPSYALHLAEVAEEMGVSFEIVKRKLRQVESFHLQLAAK
jgi:phenylacetate-CoA ligase